MLGALCRHKLRGAAPAPPTPDGASRSSASSTYPRWSFEEQRQLHLPLPLETYGNGPELHSPSRDEWTRLREQADNAKARDLYWKPLSWLGTIRPTTANDAFDPALGRPFFSTTLGCVCACVFIRPVTSTFVIGTAVMIKILVLSSLPRHNDSLLKAAAKSAAWTFMATTQALAQLTKVHPRRTTGSRKTRQAN